MAIITGITALNMARVFPQGYETVVTTLTSSQNREMIYLDHVIPITGAVTEFAIPGGRNMQWRRRTRTNTAGQRVATPALHRGALKYPFYMTGLTTDQCVGKIQWETGFIVIKALRSFSCVGINPAGCKKYRKQQKQPQG